METFKIVQLDELPPVNCPCGEARRGFWTEMTGSGDAASQSPASVHLVHIRRDATAHYHKKTTEIYVVLSGQGSIELNGRLHPIQPLTAILIPPGTVHRAVGEMEILNIAIPCFDPRDEWVADQG